MSKRFYPQQYGDRKKAKLDVTISDHNFPLSQNPGPSKESSQTDIWGDDGDDEILLLASQACEEANYDISSLPDYSMCMLPTSTSTQMFDPGPSTSKTSFAFKKPNSIPPNTISTNLKDKCNRISSPLPGISAKVVPKVQNDVNLSDDLIFNDKICEGQGSNHVYRQLLQLQEENTKLKSENGKLLDKCVTKEGEASILRTQLKSCQTAVDNARLERIKAQEKVQMEWTEKLTAANSQMHDLRTQLDFKVMLQNLEIISIKERCKMLENNKVRLTQVTVANNDISTSHRNNSVHMPNDSIAPSGRRAKMTSNSVQTEDKAHFLRLNKSCRSDQSNLTQILPLILEPSTDHHSLLEYNEKLQKHTDVSQVKCQVYNTFHRAPATAVVRRSGGKVAMGSVYEDLMCIAAGEGGGKIIKVFNTIKKVLTEVVSQLELVSQKMTTAFQKEMDERYIEATTSFLVVDEKDLLSGRSLYTEEQAILARRLTAILACILQNTAAIELFNNFEESCRSSSEQASAFMDLILRICNLLDSTFCALLYSGLLLSMAHVIHKLIQTNFHTKSTDIIKCMISARPMPFVSCELVKVIRKLSMVDGYMGKLCPGSNVGNLKVDYDQGVLLYKKDSCTLQVLLKQVEAALKCIERQEVSQPAVDTTRHLIALYSHLGGSRNMDEGTASCDCQLVLMQVIVYALRICAVMLSKSKLRDTVEAIDILSVCRCGIALLYRSSIRDAEFSSQLGHGEGFLHEFCDLMRGRQHGDVYANMLSELSSTFQSTNEDMTSSFHRQAWLKSFETFSLAD